jgi:hypothetical protein
MRVSGRFYLSINFVAWPTNHSPLGFDDQIKKPARWFYGSNHQTIATNFKAQTGKLVNLDFEAKPRNLHSSSPCARCRPHIESPDLSIIWPLCTRLVLDHPWSSIPSLLLLPRSSFLPTMSHLSPTHHETSKHISPQNTNNRVEPPKFLRFKFKSMQVNYSSQVKPRWWPLGFSAQLRTPSL